MFCARPLDGLNKPAYKAHKFVFKFIFIFYKSMIDLCILFKTMLSNILKY